jgi:tetratricopeptide (TPR) repeat protein
MVIIVTVVQNLHFQHHPQEGPLHAIIEPSRKYVLMRNVYKQMSEVDQSIQKISKLLQANKLIPALFEYNILAKKRVGSCAQIDFIHGLSKCLREKVYKIELNWVNRMSDPKQKKIVYGEMLEYCQFIAEEKLGSSFYSPVFIVGKIPHKSTIEIKKVCGDRALEVYTMLLQGNCLMYMGDYVRALSKFQKVSNEYPNLYFSNLSLGKLYLSMGNGSCALDIFDKLLNKYSDEIEVYIGFALAQEVSGYPLLAYDWILKALAIDPENTIALEKYKSYKKQYDFNY